MFGREELKMSEQKNNSIPENTRSRSFQTASLFWVFALTAAVFAVSAVIAFFPARVQSAQTTQTFRAGRFALEVAEVNVKMLIPYQDNTQKVLFRLDTVTGDVWALQMSTRSMVNPEITSAGWVKVQPKAPVPQPVQGNPFQQF